MPVSASRSIMVDNQKTEKGPTLGWVLVLPQGLARGIAKGHLAGKYLLVSHQIPTGYVISISDLSY